MVWEQKRSSFETGQKSASSIETGTVTGRVPTYIYQNHHIIYLYVRKDEIIRSRRQNDVEMMK
jgi:hypothetical protein